MFAQWTEKHPKLSLYLNFILVNFVVFVFYRLVFLALFSSEVKATSASSVLYALYLGIKFDLRLSLILTLPMMLFSLLPFADVYKKVSLRKAWLLLYTGIAAAWSALYFFDFGHFDYLKGRITPSILRFAEDPLISFQMVWQSYPVLLLFFVFLLQLFVYYWGLKKTLLNSFSTQNLKAPIALSKKRKTATVTSFVLLVIAGLYGSTSHYPLRWSEAFFHPNPVITASALNPVLYFFDTLKFKNEKNHNQELKQHLKDINQFLGVSNSDSNHMNFARSVSPKKKWDSPPNVILIVMESLAHHRTGLMGNPARPTPRLDQIAKESYYFSEYYVPSEGTARSIYGMVTSIPDVTSIKTASRNPLFADQRVIMNEFKDHQKLYFIGGSANWANIRAVFTNNIRDIQVIEEGHYDLPRTDVWGLSDWHLFRETHRILGTKKVPFFAFVQAASFHRPYTIPDDHGSFQKKEVSDKVLQDSGFESLDEYNSLRFTDFSLGWFFDEFKKSPYYENTILVITGDHGLPTNKASFLPKGRIDHEIEKFHVPLIIHNPKLFPKGTEDSRVVSEVDVMTTLAGLADVEHTNTTLGRDLFDPQYDDQRYALLYKYYSPDHTYYLMSKDLLLRTDQRGNSSLYEYLSANPGEDVKEKFPEKYRKLLGTAKGLFSASSYLLRNNKKENASF